MGRLTRAVLPAAVLAGAMLGLRPAATAAFDGFGSMSADATFGVSMEFSVELVGDLPDRLELLLRFADDDALVVAPVTANGPVATYSWDASERHVTPNTPITYSWRATQGAQVSVSDEGTLLYDDDRAGLDWQSARFGEATVHWYGGAESIARRFGDLAAEGAGRAEDLLGHEMSGPVDIFVYDSRDDFFGALGPGAREWTGAATYPELRTIFMWLQAGGGAYLETTLVHEVTHVVFNDATDNPFHEPAKWLNEGLATWSETESAEQERAEVEFEASGGGLFAFDAIAEQFPIGERGSRLAYAQGATMVDMIVTEHGREAVAAIAAAYRGGASDAGALEAATGVPADELYADFYAEFGVEAPEPIAPEPIPLSDVRKPGGSGGTLASGAVAPTQTPSPAAPSEGAAPTPWPAVVGVVAVLGIVVGTAWYLGRRGVGERSP